MRTTCGHHGTGEHHHRPSLQHDAQPASSIAQPTCGSPDGSRGRRSMLLNKERGGDTIGRVVPPPKVSDDCGDKSAAGDGGESGGERGDSGERGDGEGGSGGGEAGGGRATRAGVRQTGHCHPMRWMQRWRHRGCIMRRASHLHVNSSGASSPCSPPPPSEDDEEEKHMGHSITTPQNKTHGYAGDDVLPLIRRHTEGALEGDGSSSTIDFVTPSGSPASSYRASSASSSVSAGSGVNQTDPCLETSVAGVVCRVGQSIQMPLSGLTASGLGKPAGGMHRSGGKHTGPASSIVPRSLLKILKSPRAKPKMFRCNQ